MKSWAKWVGGKRQLLPELLKHIPERFDGLIEVADRFPWTLVKDAIEAVRKSREP